MKWQFKEEKSFEERVTEASKIRAKYPNRIPVVVEKRPESRLPDLTNKKYLVEKDSTAAQFLYTIRKRLPQTNSQESKYKDKDNFLYISYSDENVFGIGEENQI